MLLLKKVLYKVPCIHTLHTLQCVTEPPLCWDTTEHHMPEHTWKTHFLRDWEKFLEKQFTSTSAAKQAFGPWLRCQPHSEAVLCHQKGCHSSPVALGRTKLNSWKETIPSFNRQLHPSTCYRKCHMDCKKFL